MQRNRARLEKLAARWGARQGYNDHTYQTISDQVLSMLVNLSVIGVAVLMQATEHTLGWDIFSMAFAVLGGFGLKCSHVQFRRYTKFVKYIKTKGCNPER